MDRQIQIIVLALVLFSLPLVSSLAVEQYANRTLIFYPRLDGAVVSGTVCNITILYPNNSIMIDYLPLEDNNDKFIYNLTSDNTAIKGEYTGSVTCISSTGVNETIPVNYLVNLGGVEPSQQRTDALTRTLYFIFGLGILLFIAFFFIKSLPMKATTILLALLFVLIGVNIIFITLQDEVINVRLENFFSSFTAFSYIICWFIAALIGVIWLLTFFVTLFEKLRTNKNLRNEW